MRILLSLGWLNNKEVNINTKFKFCLKRFVKFKYTYVQINLIWLLYIEKNINFNITNLFIYLFSCGKICL